MTFHNGGDCGEIWGVGRGGKKSLVISFWLCPVHPRHFVSMQMNFMCQFSFSPQTYSIVLSSCHHPCSRSSVICCPFSYPTSILQLSPVSSTSTVFHISLLTSVTVVASQLPLPLLASASIIPNIRFILLKHSWLYPCMCSISPTRL